MQLRMAMLATLMTVCAAHAQEAARPMLTVGWIDAPVIDGAIGAEEWAGATGVGGFAQFGGAYAISGPSCLVAADEGGLVLACSNSDAPNAQQRGRDGSLWQDDAMEVFVQPAGSAEYFQVIVNAVGDIADLQGRDASWNANVQAAAGPADGGWCVEMRIPWSDLGGAPQPGDTWRVNFARDIAGGTPLTWAAVKNSFHEPDRFGELRFSEAPAPCGVASVRWGANNALLVDAQADGATLTATLLAGGAEVASDATSQSRVLELPVAEPGSYVLRMAGDVGGEMVFRQELPVERNAPVEITLTKGLLEPRVVIVGMDASAASAQPDGFRAQVGDLPPVRVEPGAQPMRAEATVSTADLQPGTIPVVAEALRGEEVVARAETSFELPPDPAWLGSDEGRNSAVPKPWKPLRARGDAVRVWEREYAFGDGPLLSELTTRDAQVLASPMRLVTVAGGRGQAWRDARLRWTDRTAERALGRVTAQAEGASLDCGVRCEFDGMMVFDLSVTPAEGQALEEIVLEIPLREEYAKYLHAADASWGGSVATALPEDGWEHRFMPFVFLGDEWRGVQWFAESDEGWRPRDPARAITISTRDGVTTLRVRMVEQALPVGESFSTTFGIQATPVREPDPGVRTWHITHGAFYGMQDQPASVSAYAEYQAEGNLSLAQGSVEMWISPLFDPAVEVDPASRGRFNRELLRIVQANGDHVGFYWNIDDRGMRLYSRLNGDVKLYAGPGKQPAWERGSWHHVAFTWGGGVVTVWIDGEKLASTPWAEPLLPGTLEGAQIIVGSNSTYSPCEFAVDELRVSSAPREFDTPPPRDVPADKQTLLLDGFEGDAPEVAAEATTRKVISASQITYPDGVDGRAMAFGAPDERATLLDYLQAKGVNTLVIHQEWAEIQAYGSTELHQQQLHDLVAACHDHGMRLLIYFGYELSDIAPEWDLYGDEVLVKPQRGGYHRSDYEQTAYICCFESAWKEYYLTSIARMIDEYDIDGVYLDGTTEPFGCTNELHGDGYVGEDGQRHRTYPIFAVRDLMRRMREVVKSRKPDGLISAHMSATVSIPTLAFVDDYWDGEQLDVHERGFRLPLDAFRAEFMGHNWGVPSEFLSYLNKPFTYEESVPLALLHDVAVRPYARSGELMGMMSRVWDAWDAIDIERAEWFPYWQGGGPVTAAGDDVLVSTHVGPGGALVVAMNATGEARTMRLTLGMDATSVRELIHDREVPVQGGVVSIETPAWEGAVLLVR